MNLYEAIRRREEAISVVGLGYVGLPIAVSFAQKARVIGFDLNERKIELYKRGVDPTDELGGDAIAASGVEFTSDPAMLKQAKFHIIAVPTPVHEDHTPDLTAVISASKLVGRNLARGSIVVFESTVYPGVTESVCVPALEAASGLKCGEDFKVGYSPERINPGDKVHRLESIVKIVSGSDAEALDTIARVYEMIVRAGVHRAESILVAEAAKVIENCQRDINIAFMNELSIIFHKLGIDTKAVLQAAGTKWNFLKFEPGLVGGHCIGVDPYYLTFRAEQAGYHSRVILAGRFINDDMGRYVAENVVKCILKAGRAVRGAHVAILGFTFKEDCSDARNTRVIDIVRELREYGIEPVVADPVADAGEALGEYGVKLAPMSDVRDMDAVIVAVAHSAFRQLGPDELDAFFRRDTDARRVLVDVKGVYDKAACMDAGYVYWRL